MSETISKASVCEILADIYPTDGEKVVAVKEVDKAYEAIQQLPPADVRPVVHCKDCRWRMVSMDCTPFCSNDKPPVYATTDYFGCIYGKRKGADE